MKGTLNDFAMIIIINLVVALFVALFFVPAIIERNGLNRRQESKGYPYYRRIIKWNKFYSYYIVFTQKQKWIYLTLFVLAFGIPLSLLPRELGHSRYSYGNKEKPELKWYEVLYNKTIGSDFYQDKLREPLEKVTGGTLRLFHLSNHPVHFRRMTQM